MKKLIMIVIVLVIASPAVALIYPPHSPGFGCCGGSGQVIWEFLEEGCMPTNYIFDYGPADDLTFGTRYDDGGPVPEWVWSDGAYTVNDEDSLNQPVPDSGGKQYMRMYFEVVHTLVESEDPSLIGLGLELWDMGDWEGCPGSSDGSGGEYINGYEFPEATVVFDIGGGWFQSVWVADFSEDGSVYMPGFEGYEFPDLYEATHTTAIIGMSDFGATGFDIEEV
jgi:hypothetical protein